VPFGAFVLLEGGIEAIIPNSELSLRRVSKPQDVVNPGDVVESRIIELKPEERKLTLSIRRLLEEAQREQEGAQREAEYREFREYSSGGSAPSGGGGGKGRKRDMPERGGVTLGDVFGEQFARARKEVSRKGSRKGSDYDAIEDGDGDGEGEEE